MRRSLILLAAGTWLSACGVVAHRLPLPPAAREVGFADSRGRARIYYEAAGTGPAMLFIHGLGGNHAAWFHQIPRFAHDHRAIAYSQRGFAPSSSGGNAFDVDLLVEDAVAVLGVTGAKDAVVVGQSMGGWTALGLAVARPDLVRGVVLSGTVAGVFDAEIERHYAGVTERARSLGARPQALGRHPALSPRFGDEHPDEAYLYQLLTSFGAPRPADVAEGLGRSRFSPDAIRKLRVPVLFVVGAEDPIFPPDIVRRAAALVPGSVVEIVDGAGHSPYFERPEAWNDIVAHFAAGIDRAR